MSAAPIFARREHARNGRHDLIDRYERYQRRRGFTRATIQQRRTVLRSFGHWLEPQPLTSATSDDIADWLDSHDLGSHARYSYLSSLKCFYDYLVATDQLGVNPANKVERPKRHRLVPRPLPTEHLAMALAMADTRVKAMLCLAAFDGLRCQEIAGVRADDLLFDTDPPMLIVSAPKGGNERSVPLNLRAELALRAHGIPRHGHVFRNLHTGDPLTPSAVSRIIAEHFADLGLSGSAHRCRHWFATRTYQHTLDLRFVQTLLGHADPATTAAYVASVRPDAHEVVRRLTLT